MVSRLHDAEEAAATVAVETLAPSSTSPSTTLSSHWPHGWTVLRCLCRLFANSFFFAESTLCLGIVSHNEMFPEFAPFPGFIHFLYFTFQKCRCVILSPLALFLSAPLVCDCSPLPPPLHTNTPTQGTNVHWPITCGLKRKKEREGEKKTHTAPNKEPAPVIHLTKSRLWEVLRGSSGPARVIRTQILLYVIHQT